MERPSLINSQVADRIDMMQHILDQIRQAIQTSGKTRYRIWQETDIAEAQLSRLMKGKSGLSIESLEALADCLGLEVVIRKKKRSKGR